MGAPGKKLRDYRQAQIVRLDIIAQLYKRGYSYREIRDEVMARLDLQSYSLQTVHKDVKRLLEEWRETRLESVDEAVQLELERINEIIREAWEAWEKSKQDGDKTRTKQFGKLQSGDKNGEADSGKGDGGIVTVRVERTSEEVTGYGDPRYLEIIHRCLMERRKLLGLYSPEKREVSGELSFTSLLMETGIIDAEQ
jgi:DNA-binding transcriptional MerR regulator